MTVRSDIVIAGGFGGGWDARAGELITVVDLEGEQTGDFVAFVTTIPRNGSAQCIAVRRCARSSCARATA